MDNQNQELNNLLNLLSVILGYENLIENRNQSAENNIAKHNKKQNDILLRDLHIQFEKQNDILIYQNNLLEKILTLLKGE